MLDVRLADGAAGGRRPAHARAARRRRRPARAGRPGSRARGPDRLRGGARDAPDRGLPPGRALADRPRGARGQRAARRPDPASRRAPTTCATSSSSSASSAAEVFAEVVSLATTRLPDHYDLDPIADIQVLVAHAQGPGRDRRAQRDAARAAQPRRPRGHGHALPRRRPRSCRRATTTSARSMNGEIGGRRGQRPGARDADAGRRRRPPADAGHVRDARHAATGLRLLGPQGAGLPGAGDRRRRWRAAMHRC